jgi:pilus assembly protein CpaE
MAMPESKTSVRVAVRNLVAKREIEKILLSAGGFRLQEGNDNVLPELLFYEIGRDSEKNFRVLESLLESGPVNEVFLVVERAETDFLMKAMRTGVKEVFLIPVNEQDVKEALGKFKKRRQPVTRETKQPELGKVIDVIGCKGGVGATTIAVNLAASFIETDRVKSVALLDMNVIFGDIPLFLSIKPAHHWGDVMTNIERLDATYLMNILSKHQNGLHILASPSYLNGDRPATPEAVSSMIGLLQRMFDIVVIDGGQSLSPISLKILQLSDEILLVSLLNLSSLANTNKVIKSMSSAGEVSRDKVRIIVNRYLKQSDLSPRDVEKSIGKEIFWMVPNDYKTTISAINNGRPLLDIASKAAVTKSIKDLADTIIKTKHETETKRFWGFLSR